MAIFRTSPIIGAISGNLGGQNFSLSTSGPYVRKRLLRTNQKTQRQLAQRARFTNTTHAWGSLTENERKTWRNSAKLFSKQNRLGIKRQLSGFTFFLQYNLSHVDDPTIIPLPPEILIKTPQPLFAFPAFTAPDFIAVRVYLPVPDTNTTVYVFAQRTFTTNQRSFYNNYKFMCAELKPPGTQQIDISTPFIATYGFPEQFEITAVKVTTHINDQLFSAPTSGAGHYFIP